MTDLKLEPGKSYETRGGIIARVLCVDANAATQVICLTGSGTVFWLYPNGRQGCVRESSYDLIREHVPVEVHEYVIKRNGNGIPDFYLPRTVGEQDQRLAIGRIRLTLRGNDFDVEKVNG